MNTRQIVLDTETTGLDPELGHRIIEIGAIVIQNREITHETFHSYLNPDRESDPSALAVHRLSQEFLSNKPRFSDIIDNFLQFLTKEGKPTEVIIHNAKFDTAFFNAELTLYKKSHEITPRYYKEFSSYCKITDSLELAREMHPHQRNSLDALCKRYNIDNSQRQLHGALVDAKLLAQVYLKMTAGQTSFLDQFTKTAAPTQVVTDGADKLSACKLPVHYATPKERTAHTDRLTAIRQLAGACFWEGI